MYVSGLKRWYSGKISNGSNGQLIHIVEVTPQDAT